MAYGGKRFYFREGQVSQLAELRDFITSPTRMSKQQREEELAGISLKLIKMQTQMDIYSNQRDQLVQKCEFDSAARVNKHILKLLDDIPKLKAVKKDLEIKNKKSETQSKIRISKKSETEPALDSLETNSSNNNDTETLKVNETPDDI